MAGTGIPHRTVMRQVAFPMRWQNLFMDSGPVTCCHTAKPAARRAPSVSMAGGYLSWHREGSALYIVLAPTYFAPISQPMDLVTIHGSAFETEQLSLVAENKVAGPEPNLVFLPLVVKK